MVAGDVSTGLLRRMVREGGARVIVKADHDSDGKIRWSSNPVANVLYSSHCSIDEAYIKEVAGEHHTG